MIAFLLTLLLGVLAPAVPAAADRPKRRYGHVDPLAWEVRREVLAMAKQRLGAYPTELVESIADDLGVTPRTVYRWLKEPPKGRRRWDLPDEARGYIRFRKGRLAPAWREMAKAGIAVKSETTFRRAFKRLEPAIQAGLKKGRDAVLTRQHFLHMEVDHRNQRWQIDHSLAPIWILDPETRRLVRPWITLIVDDYSRVLVGWAFTVVEEGRADTASVLAALGAAILRYGVPKVLRFDQGSEFLGDVFYRALIRLEIQPDPTLKQAGYKKGKVERLIGFVKDSFFPRQPGFVTPHGRAA